MRAKVKLQITMADELIERVDRYATDNYMNRSALISFATTQFLNQADAVRVIKDIGFLIRKIADEGKIDEEIKLQLEEYERLCKMLTIR